MTDSNDKCKRPTALADATGSADMRTYSKYRASLRRNGHPFASVTPDETNSLNDNVIEILLTALNGNPPNAEVSDQRGAGSLH